MQIRVHECRKWFSENPHHLPDDLNFVGTLETQGAVESIRKRAHGQALVRRTTGGARILPVTAQQNVATAGPTGELWAATSPASYGGQ